MLYARNRKRRRNARRHGRNAWKGGRVRHARAARKGWRRRRGRNPGVSYNRRRRSRRGRRNPNGGALSIRRPFAAITAGYSPGTLMKAVPVVAGALGNAWFSGFVSGLPFIPGMLRSGLPGYLLSLGTAGVLGMGVGMVSPRWGAPVFFGGVLDTLIRASNQYIVPMLRMRGLGDMFDYLTRGDAASARPLYGLGGGVGDYLTPMDAATARPLYGMDEQDVAIGEELAAL